MAADTPNPLTDDPLTDDAVRKVARLSRLELTDAQVHEQRERLVAVLGYVERLRELDLDGVDPLANPAEEINRFRDDEPGAALPPEALAKMAPESYGVFVKVPKVIDEGGGA
jgi:aspartyl-tRNA(Asn)/glutamyl-tRNA(Gln) amidotransferase subunit C